MPTGFEKFASKALKEEPISLAKKPAPAEQPLKVEVVRKEVRRPEEPAAPVVERETAPRTRKGSRPEAEKEDTVYICVGIKGETKTLLDEMKFRSKRKIWELVDEAINDLYQKMYR